MANKSWPRQLWCSLGVQIVAIVLAATCALAVSVTLPQTGQTTCFDSSGTEINCAGTGQDGEHRAGVQWPASRFIDNGNGTLTDNLTGLVWLKNANCAGDLYWNDALSWANSLASGACDLTDGSSAGEWRLPNILELESLVNVDHGTASCGGTACNSPAAWLASQGFANMGYGYYFSSSTAIQGGYHDNAWTVDMDDYGNLIHGSKDANYFALAVKGTSTGPAPVWRTGQTTCYDSSGSLVACAGTGQDADILAGAAWPDPRFTDNSDGTVTDNLTGLVWLKNANCSGGARNWPIALTDIAGLNTVGMMNGNACGDISNNGSHQSDWRLPNYKELLSLVDFARYNPSLTSPNPFLNLFSYHYWSSTTVTRFLPGSWTVSMWDGYTYSRSKSDSSYFVWAVRGGALPPTFAGGDGSLDDPYQVETAKQLDAVRNYLDKHFILTANIDLDVAPFNAAEGWQPIGVPGAPFTGSLDGNDYTITNLFINRPAQDHVGLFGDASGATFANMTLQVEVTGDYRVGGLVGNLEPGSIKYIHVTGTVTGITNEVGGLAGRIKYADILSSSANVPVAGGSQTSGGGSDLGGLVGNVQNGTSIADCAAYGSISVNSVSSLRTGGLLGTLWESSLERSFATGDVVGRDNVGGLVGHNGRSSIAHAFATGNITATANGITNYGGLVGSSDSGSTIINSFSTGNVTGIAMVGGLIGRQTADSSVTNSYATGSVTGTTGDVGGLIGINYDGGVTSSYYDSTTTSQSDTGKGEPRTSNQLRQQSTFTDWNFTEVWKIVEGGNYPYLAWQTFATVLPMLNAPVNDGTVADLRPTLAWLPTLTLEGRGVVGYEIQLSTSRAFAAEETESWMVWTGEPLFTSFGFAALLLLGGPMLYRNFRYKFVLLAMVGLLAAGLMSGCGNSSHSKTVVEPDGKIVTHTLTADLASGTNYFWRVRAVDDQGQRSSWSQVWNFSTPGVER
ncbi:MAG: DUF1566 domain-containing protein [Desulfuromonadales bacterium]|nr:DUF1566 domain-containing protein [Desulfuromonadales bacterium]